MFPKHRLRRLRATEPLRRLVRETHLGAEDLIYPMFVTFGDGVREEIPSMPGQYRWSVDRLSEQAKRLAELKIPAVLLFGIPEEKFPDGRSAWDDEGPVQQAIPVIKQAAPDLLVVTDVCMCEYTDHGHCGWVRSDEGIDNDATLELLGKVAVSHANAGADVVAPSDMMDGRVAAIREELDEHGFHDVPILSYAAKYATAYYGPFRDAADSTPQFGDRRSHQMDPANSDEALREVELDLEEGADAVMVKPALAYLDVVRRVKDRFRVPLAAYNVSGEYAMVKAAAANGWLDERAVVMESLTSMKRAGADMIITYHAPDVAGWLQERK